MKTTSRYRGFKSLITEYNAVDIINEFKRVYEDRWLEAMAKTVMAYKDDIDELVEQNKFLKDDIDELKEENEYLKTKIEEMLNEDNYED